jgi:integrase
VKCESLSNPKHAKQWRSTLDTYVFPSIGDREVADIEAREILDVLTPIWFAMPETAGRVLQRMEAVSNLRSCVAIASAFPLVSV